MINNSKKILLAIIISSIIIFFGNLVKAQDATTGCCKVISPGDHITLYSNKTKEQCDGYKYNGSGGQNATLTTFEIGKIPSTDGKNCVANNTVSAYEGPSKITAPILSVSIPGFVKFSAVNCDNPDVPCQIPWLAEYIKALYQYSVIIIGILAVIVVMLGGVLWLTAAGNKERISSATNFIKGGIMGLLIALGSYALLFILSPNLVILNPINIAYVNKADLFEPDLDLSKTAAELNMTEGKLSELRGENPYQAGCHNIEKCKQFGDKRPEGLVQVESKYGSGLTNPKSYEAFKKALDCVNPNKIMFKIGNSQRTAKRQIELKAEKGDMAASPCCSNHGSGLAMDLTLANGGNMSWNYNESSGLKRCMNQNGLYAKLTSSPNEPWHWSPTGK